MVRNHLVELGHADGNAIWKLSVTPPTGLSGNMMPP
jgi:hypothetical protein